MLRVVGCREVFVDKISEFWDGEGGSCCHHNVYQVSNNYYHTVVVLPIVCSHIAGRRFPRDVL